MPKDTKKSAPESPKKAVTPPAAKVGLPAVAQAAEEVFDKIKKKSGINNAKVDKWQKDWLALPEQRKKYQHLEDAPQVVGEELVAITNDIVDFIQGQEGGNSELFAKVKGAGKAFAKNPAAYVTEKAKKGRETLKSLKERAKKEFGEIKRMRAKTIPKK